MQKVSLWKKVHVIYSFFFVRKIIAHINTFVFYCVVLPATVVVPEVEVPKWGAVYIPSIITLLNAVGTPRSAIFSSSISSFSNFLRYVQNSFWQLDIVSHIIFLASLNFLGVLFMFCLYLYAGHSTC